MYALLRTMLFQLPPEVAHQLTLSALNALAKLGLAQRWFTPPKNNPVTVMGLRFKNRIGQAAGIDNNADYLDGLASLGYGHIEVGGVTPLAQPGNPKPRLFRLPSHQAIINRKGFPNKGVNYLREQLLHRPKDVIIGVNIGKNKDTPLERAFEDYQTCITVLNDVADYLTVNISSPNTPGLRALQTPEYIDDLLSQIKRCQLSQPKYVPIALKIAPDLTQPELTHLIDSCLTHEIDAIIATNTTLDRQGVEGATHAIEAGGLSGKPLQRKSFDLLAQIIAQVNGQLPVISVGGILSQADIAERLAAGAALVQVYTGLIYVGPGLLAGA